MWIREWRLKNGITRRQLGEIAHCSAGLIAMLEEQGNCVTHPRIADRIVAATGGTAAQRDGIVPKQYRGQPSPPAPAPELFEEILPRVFPAARAVVCVDRQGVVLARYAHAQSAADMTGYGVGSVKNRCNRRRTFGGVFKGGYTFRYADEWEAMTAEERQADLAREEGYEPKARAVLALNRYGTVVGRHSSASRAAHAYAVSEKSVKTRCKRSREIKDEFKQCGYTFRYADEWEAMTTEEKKREFPEYREVAV